MIDYTAPFSFLLGVIAVTNVLSLFNSYSLSRSIIELKASIDRMVLFTGKDSGSH